MEELKLQIEKLWNEKDTENNPKILSLITKVMDLLNEGKIKVVEYNGLWHVNEWIKKAILLSFKYQDSKLMHGCFDKVPLKFENFTEQQFQDLKIRVVPGAIVRRSAYIAPNTVIMPSFINVGAYISSGTMIDTWSTVGSCAYIGKNCHISGGVGIGGVLEPIQANPVIIEDNCFIGARSEVAEGVIVEEGSVLAMGVYLARSTKIFNRMTGEITYGKIPPYSVVVPGSLPSENGASLYAAIIIKQVDESTRAKTSINELLRG